MNITHTHIHAYAHTNTPYAYNKIMYIICLNNFKKEDGHRPDGRALLEYRSIGLNTGKMISHIIFGVWV